MNTNLHLILGITGASGAMTAKLLMQKSPWPITLVASSWGQEVYNHECYSFQALKAQAKAVFKNTDLSAPIASGSVPTRGMIITPCSCNTLGEIASGIANTLITRAAHCHLKEKRPLVLCLRESPLSHIDIENCAKVSQAGGIIMPISPPFYMLQDKNPESISWYQVMAAFIDRVLVVVGNTNYTPWTDRL